MKKRNTVLYYVLTLLTGGQFAFLWLFLMAHDVNSVRANHIPRLRLFSMVFAMVYVVYIFLGAYNIYYVLQFESPGDRMPRLSFVPAMLLGAIFMLGYSIYLVFRVAGFLRESGANIVRNLGLVLLFVLYLVALPLLQSKLNRVPDNYT